MHKPTQPHNHTCTRVHPSLADKVETALKDMSSKSERLDLAVKTIDARSSEWKQSSQSSTRSPLDHPTAATNATNATSSPEPLRSRERVLDAISNARRSMAMGASERSIVAPASESSLPRSHSTDGSRSAAGAVRRGSARAAMEAGGGGSSHGLLASKDGDGARRGSEREERGGGGQDLALLSSGDGGKDGSKGGEGEGLGEGRRERKSDGREGGRREKHEEGRHTGQSRDRVDDIRRDVSRAGGRSGEGEVERGKEHQSEREILLGRARDRMEREMEAGRGRGQDRESGRDKEGGELPTQQRVGRSSSYTYTSLPRYDGDRNEAPRRASAASFRGPRDVSKEAGSNRSRSRSRRQSQRQAETHLVLVSLVFVAPWSLAPFADMRVCHAYVPVPVSQN